MDIVSDREGFKLFYRYWSCCPVAAQGSVTARVPSQELRETFMQKLEILANTVKKKLIKGMIRR